ncbi:MAG: redox-regulated ATPase YchF [Acidobacteria bacterium RIFCSPLOWO2_12_FULL_54_10]|nr:MAG: redox-regulated ATPase YchF [Acidobacteria bacterium RIFCSPLOWO2_12_FULL_54_10]
MRCGIIGLPQSGKTTLFQILTRSAPSESHRHGETQHIGIVPVPDSRLDQLVEIFTPDKTTYATVEYADVAAIGKEALKESAYLNTLRNLDSLLHVVRVFRNDAVPHVKNTIDPGRDIEDLNLDLILTDLTTIENRELKLEKDRKKAKNPDHEREQAVLVKARQWLETGKPLREVAWAEDEKKRIKGYSFLSEKPMLLVLNAGEEMLGESDEVLRSYGQNEPKPNTLAVVVCGKLEAELALMSNAEIKEFLQGFSLKEPPTQRVIRATLDLMGYICFLTAGEKECRAWSIPKGSTAVQAAGAIHSDIEKHFIRAEVIYWQDLIDAGSFAAAKQKGILRLEGKEYLVKDGDVLTIRHSG